MLPFWRLSGYYFAYFAFIGAFAPYFTLYLQSLAFSATDIAILMSLMQLMRIIAPNLWGWLSERTGVRMPIVRVSALASLLGFCLFFVTSDFFGVFVAMALMSFFWSAALPLVESTTFNHLGGEGHRYGTIRSWGSAGFIVAVLLIGYALDHLPVSSLLWMSTLILATILLCAVWVPEAGRPVEARLPASLATTLRQPHIQALFGACFFMSAAHGALYVFYSIYLVENGYGKSLVGWMWTLGVLSEIVVFLLMPRMARRFSMRSVLLFAFAAAVVRFVMIGWGVGSLPILVVAQLLHGATFGAYHAAAITLVNRWFPGRLQASGQALYGSLSFGAGGMIGGLLSGFTWDSIGAAWTFTIGSGFALIGLVWLIRGLLEPRED
ncbi:MFS transporter [Azoarcus taiwanensis]|uniref:MFS transporter n=1 Tax=Azoarcus taiwanensis TaxID=666964 RepID=A0A972J970_9RHOO|nr:MFS transporter [Azoarcus taiwanensis]NMG04176.1 MFS transporter [Azoarcus taiwanensis]